MSKLKRRTSLPKRPCINYGKLFVDTYCIIGNHPRLKHPCGYILAPILLKPEYKNYRENLDLVLDPRMKDREIIDVDGVPGFLCRVRFVKMLSRLEHNPGGIFLNLRPIFTEQFIKDAFTMPNVWLLHHNVVARKAAAHELNIRNVERKKIPISERMMHNEIVCRTANRSANACVRHERSLQRR